MKTSNCNVTFICEWVNRPSFDKTSNICLYIPSYQANTVSLAWQRVKKTAKPWNISSHSFNRYEAIIGTSFPPRGYSTSFRHSFRLTSEFSIFGLTLILKNVCPLQFSFSRVYQWVNKLVTIVFFFFCQWWVCGKTRPEARMRCARSSHQSTQSCQRPLSGAGLLTLWSCATKRSLKVET